MDDDLVNGADHRQSQRPDVFAPDGPHRAKLAFHRALNQFGKPEMGVLPHLDRKSVV